MLILLLLLSWVIDLHGRICPPSCEPPRKGCQAYAIKAECSQDVRDISTSEAHCGCLWQTYIQTVEPEARIIFTNDGNQCYTWSAEVCSYLDEKEKDILRQGNSPQTKLKPREFNSGNAINDLLRRIERLESIRLGGTNMGVAKHRRRNGVETISRQVEKALQKEKEDLLIAQQKAIAKQNMFAGDFVGKPKESKSATWIEVVPEKLIPRSEGPFSKVTNSSSDKHIYHVRQHWIDIDMPVDKFKLSVFMLILLLNILFVVVLILCRRSRSSGRHTDTKPAGDLDESVYLLDSPPGRPSPEYKAEKSQISNFFKKFVRPMNINTNEKRRVSSPFIQMEQDDRNEFFTDGRDFSNVRTSSPYVNAGMYRSPKKVSRGLYENIEEEPIFLDHTYEDPLPPPPLGLSETRDHYRKNYSLRSDSGTEDGSSPTKYFPRDPDANNKSVSFTLPPGTYITLQDRVDGSTTTGSQERSDERPLDATQTELQ